MKIFETLNGRIDPIKPIWIMRQAGRYLPEYRALRSQSKNFMEFCLNKDCVVEATLQPIRRFDFDAAIIFSDILVIPQFLGQKVNFEEGIGPTLDAPVWKNILENSMDESIQVIYESIQNTRKLLDEHKALIGFIGCPWTIASYMINQGKTNDFARLIGFCRSWTLFEKLIDKLTLVIANHAVAQIFSGANVIQLFESWASAVPLDLQEDWLFKPARKIIQHIQSTCPKAKVVYYGKGIAKKAIEGIGIPDVAYGVSHDCNLSALENISVCLQGNLDPQKLLEGTFHDDLKNILEFSKNRPFIVNLGHGILPNTPIDHVQEFINLVRQH